MAGRYANCPTADTSQFHNQVIYLAQSSVAALCILPMQDVLGFGNDCRMNRPGTAHDNWQWRCAPYFITEELAAELKETTRLLNTVLPVPVCIRCSWSWKMTVRDSVPLIKPTIAS
ncbi:MAG: hypothetical protein D3910_27575 [Candidatus Electrothrix sp. ATG2]|nr:hypothetical protein [Candidatus Electrothrix sp. ATG2]